MPKKITTKDFIVKAIAIHGNKYDYSKVNYITNRINVTIICHKHGEFTQTPDNHISGKGCPYCAGNTKLTTNDFIEKAKLIHGDFYDYSLVDYKGRKAKIKIICPIHGEFGQIACNHLNGEGCLKCGIKLGHIKLLGNTNEFISKANEVHKNKYDYSKVSYINVKTKVIIICPIHGEFKQVPNKHLSGDGCPICSESRGEREIRNLLITHNIKYKTQYKFPNCKNKRELPFDFYLPDYNICIEFNGEQHYRPVKRFGGIDKLNRTQTNDQIKKDYCKKNNIHFIIIKYNESPDKILDFIRFNNFKFN